MVSLWLFFFNFLLIYVYDNHFYFLFCLIGWYYAWPALVLLVIFMFFTHVVILLKLWYVISDKQKYISLLVVVAVRLSRSGFT